MLYVQLHWKFKRACRQDIRPDGEDRTLRSNDCGVVRWILESECETFCFMTLLLVSSRCSDWNPVISHTDWRTHCQQVHMLPHFSHSSPHLRPGSWLTYGKSIPKHRGPQTHQFKLYFTLTPHHPLFRRIRAHLWSLPFHMNTVQVQLCSPWVHKRFKLIRL